MYDLLAIIYYLVFSI